VRSDQEHGAPQKGSKHLHKQRS